MQVAERGAKLAVITCIALVGVLGTAGVSRSDAEAIGCPCPNVEQLVLVHEQTFIDGAKAATPTIDWGKFDVALRPNTCSSSFVTAKLTVRSKTSTCTGFAPGCTTYQVVFTP